MSKGKIAGIALGAILVVAAAVYVLVTPYDRLPGVRLGGTETPPPADWRAVDHESVMRLEVGGFPPFVVHVWFVGTEHGVITATAPDNGYWGRRTRENPEARIRIADAAYEVRAAEVLDMRERRVMLGRYVDKYGLREVPGMTLDDLADPALPWEVFFWTPRSPEP